LIHFFHALIYRIVNLACP